LLFGPEGPQAGGSGKSTRFLFLDVKCKLKIVGILNFLKMESAYKNLKKTHSGAITTEPDDKESEGAQAASSLADLITQLIIIQKPQPQFPGSHKLKV
jgi:hypothetical protein